MNGKARVQDRGENFFIFLFVWFCVIRSRSAALWYYILFVQCLLYQTVNEQKHKRRDSLKFIFVPFLLCCSLCTCVCVSPLSLKWELRTTMGQKSGGEKNPNKIQNSKCEKLCDAQAHAYKHITCTMQTHEWKESMLMWVWRGCVSREKWENFNFYLM